MAFFFLSGVQSETNVLQSIIFIINLAHLVVGQTCAMMASFTVLYLLQQAIFKKINVEKNLMHSTVVCSGICKCLYRK